MNRLIAIATIVLFASVLAAQKAANKDEATYRKIEAQLESTKLDVVAYEDADVTEVVRDIAKKARITIVFDKKALEGVDEDDRKITLELADIKASNALNIVLDQIKLTKAYKNGVLYVTTKEQAQSATITKTYDVRDITMKIQDFPAPKLRLRGNDGDDSGPIVEFPDDKDVEAEDIVDLIEESIEADWGGKATVKIVKGQLVVSAPRDVHKKIADLLNQLRASK
jgi:type II secretory pathway component GspD/PulD (secretin)